MPKRVRPWACTRSRVSPHSLLYRGSNHRRGPPAGPVCGYPELWRHCYPYPARAHAIASDNRLYIFNPTTPSVFGITKPITGLDFRLANGQLYALATASGSGNKLYTINAATGAATLVGTINAPGGAGFDFNPVADRIRITNGVTNLRVNPVNTSFVRDGDIRDEGGFDLFNINIQAVAYSNNFAGATTTKLYAVNSRSTDLLDIFSPNEGLYRRVGRVNGFGPGNDINGFDIGGISTIGYGIFTR